LRHRRFVPTNAVAARGNAQSAWRRLFDRRRRLAAVGGGGGEILVVRAAGVWRGDGRTGPWFHVGPPGRRRLRKRPRLPARGTKRVPQGLKPVVFSALFGMTEVMPCYKAPARRGGAQRKTKAGSSTPCATLRSLRRTDRF